MAETITCTRRYNERLFQTIGHTLLTTVKMFTQVTPRRAVPHPDRGQHSDCQKFHANNVPHMHVLRLQVHVHVGH